MSYHITERNAMRVVGIRLPLTEDMEENQRTVPRFWEETLKKEQFSQICMLSDENPAGILGLTVYHDPPYILLYRCRNK